MVTYSSGFYFFRSRHNSYLFDYGKEVIRYIKNIEKKLIKDGNKLKILKKESFHKKYSRNSDLKKINNSNRNFPWLSNNQLICITNLSKRILHKFVFMKQKRNILNIYSKFLKFNLYLFTKKKISGFLINHKPLTYSKFVINLNSSVLPKIKNILWNSLNYFIFFKIY
jgi:hypothetical protein